MFKRFKKFVLSALWGAGAFELLKPRPSSCARIIMYHRFSKTFCPFRLSQPSFEQQIRLLVRRFKVVDLAEIVAWVKRSGVVPKNCVSITVDDGYKDFYLYAYPVLKKYNLPATVFLTTGFVDEKKWLWPDKIIYILENSEIKSFDFSLGDGVEGFDIRTPEKRHRSQLTIFQYCTTVTDEQKNRVIENLADRLEVKVPDEPTQEYLGLEWSEIAEMRKNNIRFGSHTVLHPILSKVSLKRLHYEIVNSKEIIEKKLGEEVNLFCYPNGNYSDLTIKVLKEANYLGAVTADPGFNREQIDLFKLKRIGGGELPIYYFARKIFFPL